MANSQMISAQVSCDKSFKELCCPFVNANPFQQQSIHIAKVSSQSENVWMCMGPFMSDLQFCFNFVGMFAAEHFLFPIQCHQHHQHPHREREQREKPGEREMPARWIVLFLHLIFMHLIRKCVCFCQFWFGSNANFDVSLAGLMCIMKILLNFLKNNFGYCFFFFIFRQDYTPSGYSFLRVVLQIYCIFVS